jgi:hypothetical protein
MAKRKTTFKDIYVVLKDFDQMKYNCFIPNCPSLYWVEKANEAKNAGRNINFYTKYKEDVLDPKTLFNDEGLVFTEENLLETPIDRTKEYKKKLPIYAQNADRHRIMEFVCFCGKSKYGILNKNYPGKDALWNAPEGEYILTCIKCGRTDSNNKNWWR